MAFNGAGVRDTSRTLKIGLNTVIRALKNSRHEKLHQQPLPMLMSHSFVKWMNNGVSWAKMHSNTGSGMPGTQNMVMYWLTRLVREPTRPVVNSWRFLRLSAPV